MTLYVVITIFLTYVVYPYGPYDCQSFIHPNKLLSFHLMAFITYARSAIRCTRLTCPSRLSSGRRHASTYNVEVAGLSEEQTEVRRSMSSDWYTGTSTCFFSSEMRFPSSHNGN